MCSRCVKRVFYSAFVRKCTDMCKHRFGVQLLQNPPLCSTVRLGQDRISQEQILNVTMTECSQCEQVIILMRTRIIRGNR